MITNTLEIYQTVDPDKKTPKWANGVIGDIRRDWRHVVNLERIARNKLYLYSSQPMDRVVKSFKDKDFKARFEPFEPLGCFDTIRNAMLEELIQSPPLAEFRATDPSAITEKEDDIQLLRSRKIVETDITRAQNQVGLPGYKVAYSNFNGNVNEFDKMGLDENDSEDVNFFCSEYHRLNHEIAGQSLIINVMKSNKWDRETAQRLVDDILAARFTCTQTFVDKMTGEIKVRYLYPEVCKGLLGDASDGRNDLARGWEESLTVMEWLQRVGNEFDFADEWKWLLRAINVGGGDHRKVTGFIRNGQMYDAYADFFASNDDANKFWNGPRPTESNMIQWGTALTYKISVGYIEWITCEATGTTVKNLFDKDYIEPIPYEQRLERMDEVKGYFVESDYQQQWYCAYYLSGGVDQQWIYNYSKVYYQTLEGANDEYANGSLQFLREPGKPGVEIVKNDIDLANLVWYKFLYLVDKIKPTPEQYVFEELIQQAQKFKSVFPEMFAKQGSKNAIENIFQHIIQYQRENSITIRSYPQVEGRTIPQIPVLTPNTPPIDPVTQFMQGIIDWAEYRINKQLGWNPMRSGMNPPSRESTQSEQATVQASNNTTNYIFRMVQRAKFASATTILLIAQDIIEFKESAPYKWLKTLMGNEGFADLGLLDKVAAHRYGMFVEDYNARIDKQDIKVNATLSLNRNQITYDQWFAVTQTEDPKKASRTLAYLLLKKAKKERQYQKEDAATLHQYKMEEVQLQIDLENTKGGWMIKAHDIDADRYKYGADKQYDAKVDTKNIQVNAEPAKQDAKTESAKDIANTKQLAKVSEAFPTT